MSSPFVRSRACLLALLALLPLAACGETYTDQLAVAPKARGYHCPMHPQFRLPGPGSCGICHMDLVPDEVPAAPGSVPDRASR